MERDPSKELRAGGGCLLVLGVLFAISFTLTWRSLTAGADTVHPVLWPIWKLGGNVGVLVFGVALTFACFGLGTFALRRGRSSSGK